ncbi:ribonuclease HI family protein [Aerococcaceae bacterium WGS1372]
MIKIYSDAAFKQKTREVGIGIQIISEEQRILNKTYIPWVFDNHVAEFLALISALNYVTTNFELDQAVLFYSDSRILIESLEKAYSKHDEYSKPLAYLLNQLDTIPLFFPKWIPEAQNKGADHLARQALRREGKLYKAFDTPIIDYSDL